MAKKTAKVIAEEHRIDGLYLEDVTENFLREFDDRLRDLPAHQRAKLYRRLVWRIYLLSN